MKKEIKGIYLIERIETVSDETKKYYVGQALDIFDRFNQHCTETHSGIDAAITKLGSDKFSFRILEIVKRAKDLNACETKWINIYKELYGDERIYNIAQTQNARKTINSQIKAKIKTLFEEDLGRSIYIIRKSKFPQNPKRSVRFSGKRTKRSVQKRKARNTQKAETKVL